MTLNPLSLFKDGLIRKADKAALRVSMREDDAGKDQADRNSMYIVGGALLRSEVPGTHPHIGI